MEDELNVKEECISPRRLGAGGCGTKVSVGKKERELPDTIGHVDLASERSEALLTQEAEAKAKEEEFLGRFYSLPNKVAYDWRSTKLARKLHRAKKAKASWQR